MSTLNKYAAWVTAYDSLTEGDRAAIAAHIAQFALTPSMAVIIPLAHDETLLGESVQSVYDQLYPNWELVVIGDVSLRDERMSIAATMDEALRTISSDFITILAPADRLAPHALYVMAYILNAQPHLSILYSDEDSISADNQRLNPWCKGNHTMDLLYAQDYLSRMALYRSSIVTSLNGWLYPTAEESSYALSLRAAAATHRDNIYHLPYILYHRRQRPLPPLQTVRETFQAAYHPALQLSYSDKGLLHASWPVPEPSPAVTIIIPSSDNEYFLRHALTSIRTVTDYSNYSVLIIDHRSLRPAMVNYLASLAGDSSVRIIRYDGPFNFAAINNFAVQHCDSELICFLNDDTEVITAGWLRELVSHALRPDVGAVGAKLLLASGLIQHAGVVLGANNMVAHYFYGMSDARSGYYARAQLTQEVAAVTAACMVMRRELFLQTGGFDAAQFTSGFGDIDLCLRLRKQGYHIIYTPFASLYHIESASRRADSTPVQHQTIAAEAAVIKERWGAQLSDDPFYNRNLSLPQGDFSLAFPPRIGKPWLEGKLRPTYPIIIIGMKHSGTSLVTFILKQLGLFVGNHINASNEELFFLRRNEQILQRHQASWDNTTPLQQVLTNTPQLIERYATGLYEILARDKKYSALLQKNTPWGWNDAQNSLTLPIWAKIFPACRIVHIQRHGVDVASDLMNQAADTPSEFSQRCATLEGAFSLWEEYMAASVHALQSLALPAITIPFELLIEQPASTIQTLAEFCGLGVDDIIVKDLTESLSNEQFYTYCHQENLLQFAASKKLVLHHYGYG
jgi:GT2 family glycosyltransferase